MSRSKQVAIVTGASRGLGRVIAGVLAAQGVDLVIGARHAAALAATGAELMGAGATVLAVAGDVVEDLVRRRLLAAASDLGGLALLGLLSLGVLIGQTLQRRRTLALARTR